MPTQTYTPTATWGNTGQYQENGDVSDATLLQNTGEQAMDNLAYLTGAYNLTQVRQLATVADLAALKALTTQRDQDYFILDSNKRIYQFDSGSAATGDDYSVVQPTAGAGRYILAASAVPESTTRRWVISALDMVQEDVAGLAVWNDAAQRLEDSDSQNALIRGQFGPFNAGDVITSIECAGRNSGGTLTATFYQSTNNSGATSPTIVALGTLTLNSGANQAVTSSAAPLPITIPGGSSSCMVNVVVDFQAGAGDVVYLYWCALNGTRSYIRE